ncbi:MAG: DUF4328 domain-containing protein [Acidimicrobiia bacterium]
MERNGRPPFVLEQRAMRLAQLGVISITIGFVANLLLLDLLASDVHARLDHDLDPSVGLGSNPLRFAVGVGAIGCYLFVIAGFAAVVYWSYRAAKTGRMLSIPARKSIDLSVASWFIPLVNFWWPYQVIVDTMTREARERRWVLWWWIVWQIALYVAPLHFVNALFGWRVFDTPLLIAALAILMTSCALGLVALQRVTGWHAARIAAAPAPAPVVVAN